IKKRGYLIAGVSADSLLLGSRNPLTGQIEGFDIDMVKAVASALLGSPDKVQLVVITSGDRIPVLRDKRVDLVARNMTMTCDRWTQIAFSAEYYHSGLKILVRKGSTAKSLDDLKGEKVCAPEGTSTMDAIRAVSGIQPVGAKTHTGCLVLFQQGVVSAIAGDDTVLAGLAAQDPYAYVPTIAPLTAEPYGLGINADQKDLVAYVNTVLDAVKADGRWKAAYDRWLAGPLGPAPAPPVSVYGRR
ncbi:MAG: glutamate ABC transporter substrate-binding protein, partial [Actinomycetota bacterium]|nr:glutamate ABC transporter substrate-binding protein [Actinomycetota bacterium]